MKTANPFLSGFALTALTMLVATSAPPALARDSYVTDGAGMLSDATIASLNQQIGDFNQQTGKEVVVVTVPSLNGQTLQDAAEKTFAQQQVNGVLIYLAKTEREDMVLGDKASRAFFPPGAFTSIHDAMRGYFRQSDFDGGIKTGVNLVIAQYRSHARVEPNSGAARTYPIAKPVPSTATQSTSRGSHMSFFWLLIILLAGFLIIRALFRAISGPRMMPPGAGPGGPAPGPGYGPGGPGYGYGGGGGGGSFFSGLLGGLGGAWLGNEMFGRGGGQTIVQDPNAANAAGGGWGDGGGAASSGWQSDAGQADVSNAGGGDWGGGGGFDAGGGGDFGGGGGFDSGGGGGDSGGGW